MSEKITTDLRDDQFYNNSDAILVCGVWSEPHMQEFAGVGYSTHPFQMKAILVDEVVWLPDPSLKYRTRTMKKSGIMENFPMKVARIQPPAYAIKKAVRSH